MTSVVLSPSQCAALKTSRVLAASAVAINNTGNTTENTLATIAIPAGGMGPNGFIRGWVLWSYNNNANNKSLFVRLDGTSIFQRVRTIQLSDQGFILVRNRNSASSQVALGLGSNGLGSGAAPIATAAINTAIAKNLTISAQLANSADTITLEAYHFELFYGA